MMGLQGVIQTGSYESVLDDCEVEPIVFENRF